MAGQALHPPCAFLAAGQPLSSPPVLAAGGAALTAIAPPPPLPQAFMGTQNVSSAASAKEEAWRVFVRVQACDARAGYLCGSMEALAAQTPDAVQRDGGKSIDLATYPCVFMVRHSGPHCRTLAALSIGAKSVALGSPSPHQPISRPVLPQRWKEKFFVNVGSECGLTIAGFYYVCLAREDGAIHGFYYDPHSSPFQKLELQPTNEGRFGYSSATYELR
eukprot:SM000040S14797  [mRNA]  locus=s40:378816:380886:- [translate_table: standard]